MRTTVTLSEELDRRLREEMSARGTSFRETLESVLRQGLERRAEGAKGKVFEVQARPMGLKRGLDPARLHDLDTDLEVEQFLRLTRKLEAKR